MDVFERATGGASDAEVAALLEPEVRAWFEATYAHFTPAQRLALPLIRARKNVLVSSPTGSGKTLAAFLSAVDDLVALAKRGELTDRIHVVYVSPLRALGNDVRKNLEVPLEGIARVFEAAGETCPEIRVETRTGDTTKPARARQARKPPHILLTTPETLAILLVAPVMREHLRHVRYVIVDEAHALVESKRGAHLALSLERLSALAREEPVRVGLSATVHPLDLAARYVFGAERRGVIAAVDDPKALELDVVPPVADFMRASADEQEAATAALLDRLIEEHRSTIVFTNTRHGTERTVQHLKERFGRTVEDVAARSAFARAETDERSESVAAHHGSLSRETRLDVEDRLKRGELKCVVTSSSLELGIDIGDVDLVVLLGSPRNVARTLQRIGRSGHRLSAVSKGVLVPLDRDELVECVALARCARERRLDALAPPREPLDVLLQHLLGIALESREGANVEQAWESVRRAAPYADLTRETFERCLAFLAGSEELSARRVFPRIWWDRERGAFGKRGRLAFATYATNVGAIAEAGRAKVVAGDRFIGAVDESFVETLEEEDIFQLAGEAWAYQYSNGMTVHVKGAPGRRATVPVWTGERRGVTRELADALARLRGEMHGQLAANERRVDVLAFLSREYLVSCEVAVALYTYFAEQHEFLAIPTSSELLVEEFVEDEGRRALAFHSVVGRAANEALSRVATEWIARERSVDARATVSDLGFLLSIPRRVSLTARDLSRLFASDVDGLAREAVQGSELLKRRFRHVATRSLLVAKNVDGRERSIGQQQLKASVLYHRLEGLDPPAPVFDEVMKEMLEDALDVASAQTFARRVALGETPLRIERAGKTPSPFAIHLAVAAASDAHELRMRRAMERELDERVAEAMVRRVVSR